MQEQYSFAVTPLAPVGNSARATVNDLPSPHQQLSESREVGLLVFGAAIAEGHGSQDEPDPTPPTRDGGDRVQPTRLSSYRRIEQKGVHLRYVGQGCIGQGLVQVGTMLAADILRHARPSTVRQQLEVRFVLGVDPHHALGTTQLHVGCKGSHRLNRAHPAQGATRTLEGTGDHAYPASKPRRECGNPRFPHAVDRKVPCQAVEAARATKAAFLRHLSSVI